MFRGSFSSNFCLFFHTFATISILQTAKRRPITDEPYTDAELARVSVLILDVTKTAYVSPVAKRLASVMKNFNKKIDRKNLNFVNKTAI